MRERHSKLEQNLGWIVLALRLGGCLLVLLPFVTAWLWSMLLAVGYRLVQEWAATSRTGVTADAPATSEK